jgi:nucleotide-binding universal stress UspA family protein
LLRLRTVLAGTDLEPSSDSAVESAIRLARAAGAEVHIAYVSPDGARSGDPARASDAGFATNTFRERLGLQGSNARFHVKSGDPATALSNLVDEISADVIVIGRHRPRRTGKADGSIGSTAYDVITRSLAPCLVTSRSLDVPIRNAVVAVDTSETARGALLLALSWASALRDSNPDAPGTTLTALHVETGRPLSPPDAHRKRTVDHELDVLKRGAGSWAGVSVSGATETSDNPVDSIVQFARQNKPDLLVLGTRGLSAQKLSGLGSVSAAVTKQLDLPVLLVPPAVWRNYAHDIDYL